jgi:hypothetical protein
MLFKLTGSSCSGKSTAAASAGAGLDRLVVYDFDAIGVPSDADVAWRQRSLEAWLTRVLAHQAEGDDVLLTGQSPLGEILASPSATELNGIAVCLLDVTDHERFIRLERRDPGRWDPDAKRSFAGWARWHRAHADDPQSRPEVITVGGWDQMVWARWTDWARHDPRWQNAVLQTTGRSIDETASEVRAWMCRSRADLASGDLALRAGWAVEPQAR